jgi:ABC-2 type transport system ATP-binding protein
MASSPPAAAPSGTAPASTGPALAARAAGKRFGSRAALHGVSFEIGRGELVALIGPNGAGKTTLLSILAGIHLPDEGSVEATGTVGWVPQEAAIYSKLSVAENLRLFARLEGVSDPDAVVTAMLDQTGLAERAGDEVSQLSGGNRQRVNIAVGLLAAPAVLLLDEPSASLDPRQRERLWAFLDTLGERGTTVMYSTHDVAEAERHADRLLVLADGELVYTGTPASLAREAGASGLGFEAAFVRFLHERGH